MENREQDLNKTDRTAERITDVNQRELLCHETEGLPVAVYTDFYYNTSYPLHWHDELEFGYVKKGRVVLGLNSEKYTLSEGDGVFVNGGTLHTLTGGRDMETVWPNIVFHPSLVYGSEETVLYRKYMSRLLHGTNLAFLVLSGQVEWQGKILRLMKESILAAEGKEWGYEFKLRELLTEMLLLLLKNCPPAPAADVPGKERSIRRLRQMMDYISGHYAEQISLADIAGAAAVGQRECLRCFHDFCFQSPKQYVTQFRLRTAMRLLVSTTLPLQEVGESCGFQSQSYFSRTFRVYTGMTPGEYRRTGRNRPGSGMPE